MKNETTGRKRDQYVKTYYTADGPGSEVYRFIKQKIVGLLIPGPVATREAHALCRKDYGYSVVCMAFNHIMRDLCAEQKAYQMKRGLWMILKPGEAIPEKYRAGFPSKSDKAVKDMERQIGRQVEIKEIAAKVQQAPTRQVKAWYSGVYKSVMSI
jgi:hypothetical protein